MTVPRSKVLNVSRSFVAQTKVNYAYPKQSQNLIVNIQNGEKKNESDVEVKYPNPNEENPYANLQLPENVNTILCSKDRELQALKIIIDIIRNNPLIINHFIIADSNSILKLIQLLTNADEVSIVEKDFDIGCCACSDPWIMIDKIFVIKNNETLNLKYSFPDVIKILDEHKISYKMVI